MSNNIRNIGISLSEIVTNTKKGLYLIPQFQRDFVWKKNDIIDLGDPIIRRYPISSLLLRPENGSLKVKSHNLIRDNSFLFHENKPSSDNETNTKLYILDGQQRMTSIAKLFLACDGQYQYYYDLLVILVDKFPNDGVENDSAFSKRTKSTESLCWAYKIGENKSEQPTRGGYQFISGKSVVSRQIWFRH